MSLATGTRLGPYQILSALGAGGMGEVYRARDSKLNRDVAIKVLPEAFAADSERLARFTREAQTLAALNHPNIAHIHGLEESGGVRALVMELVEGEDLSAHIARGPIPIAEALPIARQIAEALEAAHDAGIVHRDLKPANIKVRADGTVKVLDFGLAKAMDAAGGAGQDLLANSPTLSIHATEAGVILGTVAYMSPEQAKGKPVDRRADLWAFGIVLYEMLTGRRAFDGETITDVIAAVVTRDPDWTALPASTPTSIRRVLTRCLTKDPRQRLADASTLRIEIDDALRSPATDRASTTLPPRAGGGARLPWAVAIATTLMAAAVAVRYLPTRADGNSQEMRLQIVTTADSPSWLSPDGRHIAYVQTNDQGQNQIFLRPLGSEVAEPVPNTDTSGGFVWSPDSQLLLFGSGQKLKRIDLATGTVQTLADTPNLRGATWGVDGTIVFAPSSNGPLYRIPDTGGSPAAVTRLQPPQASHRHPKFLLDGRHFLFFVIGPPEVQGEYVGSLDSTEIRRLFPSEGPAELAPPDHVLFVRENVLYAQRLRLSDITLVGNPVAVSSEVSVSQTDVPNVSASNTGLLAYRRDPVSRLQLTWRDRRGNPAGTIGEPLVNARWARLSPDGRHIAVSFDNALWMMDAARGAMVPFATSAGRSEWSADSARVAFHSGRNGLLDIFVKRVSGEPEEVLLASNEAKNVAHWSADGRYLLYSSQSLTMARDLWALPVAGAVGTPIAVATTAANETMGRFSPDGKFVAYCSNRTGRAEVVVQPFPGVAAAVQVSPTVDCSGRVPPDWRRDGREIYYASPEGMLMAVPIASAAGVLTVGTPESLFRLGGAIGPVASSDGKRFLMLDPVGEITVPPITVVVNWAGRTK